MQPQHQTIADYASDLHAHRRLYYHGQPYRVHLEAVYDILLPQFGRNQVIMLAALCHDLLEDTAISYNDLVDRVGIEVADVVYDVTNELGRNRQERAARTYPKTAANPLAVIVKVADRIANTRYSQSRGSSMYAKYCAEYPHFRRSLFNPEHISQWPALADLWQQLDQVSVTETANPPGGPVNLGK
jgi:(p)ppGpp synthase/HD superfamily hydrolase